MPSGGCFGPSRLVIDLAIGEMLLVLLLFLVVPNPIQSPPSDIEIPAITNNSVYFYICRLVRSTIKAGLICGGVRVGHDCINIQGY